MIREDIKSQIESERAAGFPDLVRMVGLLCDLVGEKPDPDLDLTENAYAWYLGVIELTMTRVCRGEAVDSDLLEVALWADEWWEDFEATFPRESFSLADWEMNRVPGESVAEYEARLDLFRTNAPSNARRWR